MEKPQGFDSNYDKYLAYLESDKWTELRTKRLVKDNFMCAVCHSPNQLHVHHIWYPTEYGTESINDIITLCASCHGMVEALKKEGRKIAKWKMHSFEMWVAIIAESNLEIHDFLENVELPTGNIECNFYVNNERRHTTKTNFQGIAILKDYFQNENFRFIID